MKNADLIINIFYKRIEYKLTSLFQEFNGQSKDKKILLFDSFVFINLGKTLNLKKGYSEKFKRN